MDWSDVDKIRRSVETYYQRNAAKGNINIPLYDQFVTEVRMDWERAGFDLTLDTDLFKLWGTLSLTCAAVAHMLDVCKTREEAAGAIKVVGSYGNYTGLFLREMTRFCTDVPALPEEAASE